MQIKMACLTTSHATKLQFMHPGFRYYLLLFLVYR